MVLNDFDAQGSTVKASTARLAGANAMDALPHGAAVDADILDLASADLSGWGL